MRSIRVFNGALYINVCASNIHLSKHLPENKGVWIIKGLLYMRPDLQKGAFSNKIL